MTAAALTALIARKDATELRRDRRLVGALVIVALLALAALGATYARMVDHERDRQAAARMEQTSWLTQGPRNPHSAAHFAQWAFRPMGAPALLDPGTNSYAGSAIWLEAHARNPAAARAVEDRVGALDLGTFSVAWVLQTIAPLLLLVLAAGTLARERERGTLRLLLATGVEGRRLTAAKAQALVQLSAWLVLPLLAVATLAVLLAPQPMTADDGLRIGLWVATYALYLAIGVLIGVAISARAQSVAAALVLAIGVWTVAVPIAPRVAATFAEAVAPVPSGERFWSGITTEIREGGAGVLSAEARNAAFRAALLARYGVTDVKDLPISFSGANLDMNERHGNTVFARHYADLEGVYARQRAIMRAFTIVSPTVALQNVSSALAGTDNAHGAFFAAQAEAERQRVVNALNRDLMINGARNPAYKADVSLWRQFGPFEPRPLPVTLALAKVWPDLLILLAWFGIALLALRRAGNRVGAATAA
jgi:ABC-2 type transport system permease protein